jgi:hypothetical protein
MYFLIDTKVKVIFGWSAKCGCSHIKKIYWYLQNGIVDNEVHSKKEWNSLPNDIENYTTILIIRNPYERIISGFLDKYKKDGKFRHLWKNNTITFSKFVNELIKNKWKIIDKHHFIPQTCNAFDIKVKNSKELIIYDIKNINYNHIEDLFQTKLPDFLINFKGTHIRTQNIILEKYIYDIDMPEYFDYKVPTKYFYNEEIKNMVYHFYINDFAFFQKNGFDYVIENE